MFTDRLAALAFASAAAISQAHPTETSTRGGLTVSKTSQSSKTSQPSKTCIVGLTSNTVYCPRDINQLDASTEIASLPFLEDLGEEWQPWTTISLARLRTRTHAANRPPVALAERDSLLGGTNQFALVCMYDQGLTNDCQKNWGYYCDTSGRLQTTKDDREDGCDHCECIDINPKPACVLGLTGMLYCQRDLSDDDLLTDVEKYERVTPTVGSSPASIGPASLPSLKTESNSVSSDGISSKICDKQQRDTWYEETLMKRDYNVNAPDGKGASDPQHDPSAETRGVGNTHAENNMAMVCMDDQDVTLACQNGNYGYFCRSDGKLRRTGIYTDHVCEEECKCINLRPKLSCVFWLNGMSSCL